MSKKRPRSNKLERRMVEALDARNISEEIAAPIIPILVQAMKEGWDSDKLARHPQIQLLLTARALTIAMTEGDSAKALAAVKDIKDRTQGKATERSEVTHKLEKLPDEQLDALLQSKLGQQSDDAEDDLPN